MRKEVADRKAWWVPLQPSETIITARFPVVEARAEEAGGTSVPEVRLIDDFSASGVNSATAVGEPMPVDILDTLVAVARRIASRRGADCQLHFRKEDFKGAFKSLPLDGNDLRFAVVSWKAAVEQGRALQLLCCPFGARSSVFSWHRLGSFIQALLAIEFFIAYPRFVDDLFSADAVARHAGGFAGPEGTAACAQRVIELLGWELHPEKRVRATPEAVILGVVVRAVPGWLIFSICAEKVAKWLACVTRALREDFLSPAEAKRLAGRLGWGGSVVFGSDARAYAGRQSGAQAT